MRGCLESGEALARCARCAALLATLFVARVSACDASRATAQVVDVLELERRLVRAEQGITHGDYEVAEASLPPLLDGPVGVRARLALARLLFETGRYDEAAEQAARVASTARGAERATAVALEGEALARRGRLDEAVRVLESVLDEPTAHRARVLLGRVLLRRGRTAEARAVLMRLVRAHNDETIGEGDAEGLTYVGMATAMLGSPHDANDAFTRASRAEPRRIETQLEWAELFLSHYDAGHAEECLRDALAVTARNARVQVLAARIALAQGFDFERARRALAAAEAIDPAMPAVHTLRASMALRALSFAEADAHLDRALATDPTDLEALSMRAAVRFLADDARGFEAAVRAVLAIHPTYSELYTVVAEHADWEHRYPDIVRLADAALRLNPRDARAMATRGINLLRLGQEDAGLAQLREAFRHDRFNVRVFNTLNLYEDVIGPRYEWVEAGPLRFRFHRDERPVLEVVVVPFLSDVFARMRRRYGYRPPWRVDFEMYASPQHFSVRTEGLPNLGVQGVCFGRVVTALSPRAAEIDWAQVTTHEMAHVFHIGLSRNHVPRWFTEGLAEHETALARPEWRREGDAQLARALEALPPMARLNEAFTAARSVEDVANAYHASFRAVSYLAERFGPEVFPRMLRAWAEGQPTDEVFPRVLGASVSNLDADWRRVERERLARYLAHFDVNLADVGDLEAARDAVRVQPDDAGTRARLGAALLRSGRIAEAEAEFRRAIARDSGEGTARFLLARLALDRGEGTTSLVHLDALLAAGRDGPAVALLEARAASIAGDVSRVRSALERAVRLDPESVSAWRALASFAREHGDAASYEAALQRVVALDSHDRGALAALVGLLARRGAWRELAALAERVRFLDPHGVESVLAVARAAVEQGDVGDALAATEHAVAVAGSGPHAGRARLLRVRALVLARRYREARALAADARAADPSLASELEVALARER